MEVSRKVVLVNRQGIHARPATQFVRLACSFHCEVEVEHRGERVNGKSVIQMITLGAAVGSSLLIRATGKDAEQAVDALEALIHERFGEKE